MQFASQKRSGKQKASFNKKKSSTLQKLVMAGILFVGLPFGMNGVDANQSEDFQTIHHVYLDGQYIGLVSDDKKLEQLKEEKIKTAAEKFDAFSLAIEEGLSVIPERVFTVKTNDEAVLAELEETLSVETAGIGMKVNDEVALHVKDEESFHQVIRAFKLQTVSEEQLNAYEAAQVEGATQPALAEGETRVVDMLLTAQMEPLAEKVKPEQIRTVEEAVDLLRKGSLDQKTYTVQAGDVLGGIANKNGMTTQELIDLNEGMTAETVLQIGDELKITYVKPYVELEVHYETKEKTSIAYDKVSKEDAQMDKGKKEVTQAGQNGEQVTTKFIRKKNGQVIESSVVEEQIITEPIDEITVIGTKVTPSKGIGTFRWPTVGGYVSSPMGQRWGRMHRGIDIARPSNRSILAADNGVVVSTGYDGGYGNKIVIDHNNGYRTLYAHLSSIQVRPGQTVSAGSTIGVMGSTGNSTGLHLHFEVTKNGTLLNPLSVLK